MAKAFNKAVLSSAYKHIGLKAIGGRREIWMTREIVQVMNKLDDLRKNESTYDAIKQQNEKVQEMIKEKKKQIWQRKVIETQDAGRMWQLIRNLNQPKSLAKDNVIISPYGKACVSARQKAEAFQSNYYSATKLKISKTERGVKKELNTALRTPYVSMQEHQDLQLEELERAIATLKPNKAAGPDKIHGRLLKHLGPLAKSFLLHLFSEVWTKAEVPQKWRTADVRPIPKAGKDHGDVNSFRPISLTSVVGKLMERIVTNWLNFFLESIKLLSPNKAGFRERASTEDQLLRLSQSVSDGFQCSPMQRSVLALLDFTKAYDCVWRDALMNKMTKKGIPRKIIPWTQGWRANGRSFVTIEGKRSRGRTFNVGLPQGSVIAPMLFLVYIDDIEELLPSEVNVSMYADDVALWAQHSDKEKAKNVIQEAVNKGHEWSRKWKLKLSATKCECSFFSTSSAEAQWKPNIRLGENRMVFNELSKFLGVTYDRTLLLVPMQRRWNAK